MYEEVYIQVTIDAGDSYFSTPQKTWDKSIKLGPEKGWHVNKRVVFDTSF